jgi:cell division inhibitor SulA
MRIKREDCLIIPETRQAVAEASELRVDRFVLTPQARLVMEWVSKRGVQKETVFAFHRALIDPRENEVLGWEYLHAGRNNVILTLTIFND